MIYRNAVTLVLLTLIQTTYASGCHFSNGSVICNQGTTSSLTTNGMASIDNTIISGKTQTSGYLKANNSKFESLKSNGQAVLSNCTIEKDAAINGQLMAESTIFNNNLNLHSSQSKLSDSRVNKNVHVYHSNSKQSMLLLKGSTIDGDVIFDDGNGEIIMDKSSQINGSVIGGKVIQ